MVYLITFILICMLNLSRTDSTTTTTSASSYRETFNVYKRVHTSTSLLEYLNLISNENNSAQNNRIIKCLNEKKNEIDSTFQNKVQDDLFIYLTSSLFGYLEKCFIYEHPHSNHQNDHDHDHDHLTKQPSTSSKSKFNGKIFYSS